MATILSGGAPVLIPNTRYIARLDEASPTIMYVGISCPGIATSSALWAIKRVSSASGLQVEWANGDALFTNIWDNRAALSYS